MAESQEDEQHPASLIRGGLQKFTCQKHPGHKKFIQYKDFQLQCLPEEIRREEVMTYIHCLSYLTTRVRSYGTKHKSDVKNAVWTGTGFVSHVDKAEQGNCMCPECKRSESQKICAYVHIQTATHLILGDDDNIRKTVVDLFYDDESSLKDIRRLYGQQVYRKPEDDYWCTLVCETHDIELVENLSAKLADKLRLEQSLAKPQESLHSYYVNEIIISHPHGFSKHISLGIHETSDKVRASSDRQPTEAEMTGLEVQVKLPDGSLAKMVIWQLEKPVKATKAWLLHQGGIHERAGTLDMVIELPNDEIQVMEDEKEIVYYWDDLTIALLVRFQPKVPV